MASGLDRRQSRRTDRAGARKRPLQVVRRETVMRLLSGGLEGCGQRREDCRMQGRARIEVTELLDPSCRELPGRQRWGPESG